LTPVYVPLTEYGAVAPLAYTALPVIVYGTVSVVRYTATSPSTIESGGTTIGCDQLNVLASLVDPFWAKWPIPAPPR
jgi:hypothetical protein